MSDIESIDTSVEANLAERALQLSKARQQWESIKDLGEHSPNRADAMIWGLSDLFPELAKAKEGQPPIIVPPVHRSGPNSWMHR